MEVAEHRSTRVMRWLMTVLAILVALYAIQAALSGLGRSPFVQNLFEVRPMPAFGHLFFGGVALAVGGFQFSTRLRERRVGVHRWLGRTYVFTVAVSGVSSILLAIESSGGLVAHWGFGMLGVLWLGTTGAAFLLIRSGDAQNHRKWMVRSYALCLAAVTLRIYLPISQIAGVPFEAAYQAISFLCWVPNLIVAEWLILPRLRRID